MEEGTQKSSEGLDTNLKRRNESGSQDQEKLGKKKHPSELIR